MRIQAAILGMIGGCALFFLVIPVVELIRNKNRENSWRDRLLDGFEIVNQIPTSKKNSPGIDLINQLLSRLFRRGVGYLIFSWWRDARLGTGPFQFTLVWLGIILFGLVLPIITSISVILSIFIMALLLVFFLSVIYIRAMSYRELFLNQLPDVLDRMAGSLQAGFSLPQAVGFIASNLPEPSATEMALLQKHIQLGNSLADALQALYKRQPLEEISLLAGGLSLQRKLGGDMAEMMFEMAAMVRQKVDLRNEVIALTTQGRVSAIVLALLLPVSLGLLSLLPGYAEVLYNTQIGNLVLILAGCMELVGAAIIFKMIKLESG